MTWITSLPSVTTDTPEEEYDPELEEEESEQED
jgi:hypothetical protein